MKKTENFYIVYDKVLCTFHHGFSAPNDTTAVRSVLSTLQVPLKDNILFSFGSFDSDYELNQLEIGFENVKLNLFDLFRVVPWTSYKFPESPAEALAPLGLSPDEVKAIANNKINQIGAKVDRTIIQSIVDSNYKKEE